MIKLVPNKTKMSLDILPIKIQQLIISKLKTDHKINLNMCNKYWSYVVPHYLLPKLYGQRGNLNEIKNLHENGHHLSINICSPFNKNNEHLECLKYVFQQGYKLNKTVCYNAAQYDHLECLKFAHEHNCCWDDKTTAIAAKKGNINCLKYAHENGCQWTSETCENAASEGHYNCLVYAHENGCHWDEFTCAYAYQKGELDCFKYAFENNCPFNFELSFNFYSGLIQKKQDEFNEYMRKHNLFPNFSS